MPRLPPHSWTRDDRRQFHPDNAELDGLENQARNDKKQDIGVIQARHAVRRTREGIRVRLPLVCEQRRNITHWCLDHVRPPPSPSTATTTSSRCASRLRARISWSRWRRGEKGRLHHRGLHHRHASPCRTATAPRRPPWTAASTPLPSGRRGPCCTPSR